MDTRANFYFTDLNFIKTLLLRMSITCPYRLSVHNLRGEAASPGDKCHGQLLEQLWQTVLQVSHWRHKITATLVEAQCCVTQNVRHVLFYS